MSQISAQNRARLLIVTAGVLWSLSGFFAKALKNPTVFGVHEPDLSPIAIAVFRSLFAGLSLVPWLRRRDSPRPDARLLTMVSCFALMTFFYITALTSGPAAIAILLQYTAPLWIMLVGHYFLGEKATGADLILLAAGLTGVAVIIAGNTSTVRGSSIAYALASGVAYAGVVLLLRIQSDRSASWLTACNLLGTAIVLSPLLISHELPSARQMVWIAVFGIVQLSIPYWLMATALRRVSSFEAGLLTLIEPVLNPVWAWMVAGKAEAPSPATLAGGTIIIASLGVRYIPRRRSVEPQ
ncbi:MAG: DMT family transporter [Gemmataceae bacterium]|nr:DMT family transporter [Gemmataceae bacterium]